MTCGYASAPAAFLALFAGIRSVLRKLKAVDVLQKQIVGQGVHIQQLDGHMVSIIHQLIAHGEI